MKNNLLHEGYARRFAAILLCGLLSLGAATAVAQSPRAGSYESNQAQRTVKGTVVDEAGDPVVGASVIVQGTSKGVATDISGQFAISAPADAVRNIIKIGRLSSVVKLQYFLDLMDVYASLYALRDKELQTEKFHVALLNGMAKVLPQTMAQSVHILRFLFRVFVKSLVVTKDRGFGKEFDKFFNFRYTVPV